MAATSSEWDTRIPYRLGTDQFCEFEDDGSYVRMGNMVTVCWDSYAGGTYQESECSGELVSVRYDWNGFIDSVSVLPDSDSAEVECPCEGVFHRMEDAHDTD